MKGLILAAGRGHRMGNTTERINKSMIEIGGKPIIENSLGYAIDMEVDEVIIVVGYKAEDIINSYGNSYMGMRLRYVFQHDQKGLVHAIECSSETIAGDDFILFLADEILLNPQHKKMAERFQDQNIFSLIGLVHQSDRQMISRTYSVFQDIDRKIYRLIEKPQNPVGNWMGTGNCMFRNGILNYIEQTPVNIVRGEKELPDLIQCSIDNGEYVESFEICDKYTNINYLEDLVKE